MNVCRAAGCIAGFILATFALVPTVPAAPVMGFDTYYSGWNGTTDLSKDGQTNVYCGPSEQFIFIMATNYLQDGLHALGYDWMCISDGWQGGRDENGRIYADTNRFPNGMGHTVKVLHQLGFKVRLYTEVGRGRTCCLKVKSAGTNGLNDALTFAEWKVDGITVDTCMDYSPEEEKRAAHEAFLGYFRSNNIPINYDLHVLPMPGQYTGGMQEWMAQVDTWQYTLEWGYINPQDPWHDAVSHIDLAAATTAWMRPGHTPNLLIITGDFSRYQGNFGRLLFTFWSIFQSPLVVAQNYISFPLWDGGKYQTNRYCIAIDQDPLFAPPAKMFTNGANSEVWVKPLASGSTALAMLNRSNGTEVISVDMAALGIPAGAEYTLTDGWNYTNLHSSAAQQTFPSGPNAVQLWLLRPRRTATPLTITPSGSDVTISWLVTAAPGHVLQWSTSPRTGTWLPVTLTPRQHRERQHVILPTVSRARFYRLAEPQ